MFNLSSNKKEKKELQDNIQKLSSTILGQLSERKNIIALIHDATITLDEQGTIVEIPEFLTKLLGYKKLIGKAAEIIGVTLDAVKANPDCVSLRAEDGHILYFRGEIDHNNIILKA